jgi:hypothetical protein
MTMGTMKSHDNWTDRLSEYADGELTRDERLAADEHLAGCARCRQVLSELRAVASRARTLSDRPPAADLWPEIAAEIGASRQARIIEMRPGKRFSFTLPQLVAASLALMVLSGGLVWITRVGGERTDFPAITASDEPVVLPTTFADARYDEAIADLQQTLEAQRARLDPETVRVLEQNLAAIDGAIEQCRRALEADPINLYLTEHLVAAKKRKLALLRRANALTGSAGL